MSITPTIQDIQEEIVSEFSFFDNWEDKYGYLIDLGKNLPAISDSAKTEENKIKGCQSQVWLISDLRDGRVFFDGDSDSMIVKGLVSLLIRVFSGQPPAEVMKTDLTFLDKIGLQQHLSPTRSNGLAAMIKQIKIESLAYTSK